MKIEKTETPYGTKRNLKLPFGVSICWGPTEFFYSVWVGTQNGGLFVGKDHA